MAEVRFIPVSLNDIFDFSYTSNMNLSKAFVQKNKGTVPVYGSSKIEDEVSYGYIKDKIKGIKYFDDCLTINRNGSAGYVFYRKGRFCINEDVTPLIIKKECNKLYDKKYLMYVIRKITIKKFNHVNKAGKTFLKKIVIPIPVDINGDIDLKAQKNIAKKYDIIENKKKQLYNYKKLIDGVNISFLKDINTTDVKITDLFNPALGNGRFTKKECKKIPGKYPVYSGNTVSEFAKISEFTYEGKYLTWAKDGLAGYLMYHDEKFSITNHRGILLPTEECQDVDLKYIKIVLEPIFRKKIKGRRGVEGKNEYTTLSKDMIKKIEDKIPMPISEDGTFDLAMQQEIAQKYEQVENIKKMLEEDIEKLMDKEILLA